MLLHEMVIVWAGKKVLIRHGVFRFLLKVAGLADRNGFNLKSALREVAQHISGQFILTGNQNLIIANVTADEKNTVSEILKNNGVLPGRNFRPSTEFNCLCGT